MAAPQDPAPNMLPPLSVFTRWFDHKLRWRLSAALLACLLLPFGLAALAKALAPPGTPGAVARTEMLIDFIATGACLFGLSMVLTWLIGVWVVAVMKGPQYRGDDFPAEAHRPGPADDRPR